MWSTEVTQDMEDPNIMPSKSKGKQPTIISDEIDTVLSSF